MKEKLKNKNYSITHQDVDPDKVQLSEYDELLLGHGFKIARKGRFIFFDTTRTEEEHKEILKDLVKHIDGLPASIERQVKELEELMFQHDPFDIIGNISFYNAILDPETYKEYAHEGNDAYTEYITLLCLTKPYETYAISRKEPISGEIIENIQERIKRLFNDTMIYLTLKDVNPKQTDSPDTLTELRFKSLSSSFLVRYSAYHHHLIDILTGIFTPLKEELDRTLGFNIKDALTLAESIESLLNRRLVERRNEAKEFGKKLRIALKRYRRKGRETKDIPLDLLKWLAKMSPRESTQKIRNTIIGRIFFAFGETLSFTAQDLVNETGISIDRVDAFLKKMSLEFGNVDHKYRTPSPTHPLMTKPLIRHGESYFCPVLNLIYWSLRPAIEVYLNPDTPETVSKDKTLWERYKRIRAEYVENRAIQYLSQALKHAKVYHNLKYRVSENGVVKEAQLDGLLLLDSALFLIEAKAGSLSLPARRGAPKRMIEEIKELVEEAYLQALRAKRYIQEADKPIFFLSDGAMVELPKDHFDSIFLVTVTLESMDAFITTLYQLQDLGLFKEGDLPWAVSLPDLRVISELVEYPSQLVHYLKRRYRLNELGKVKAHDELDWFGHYLKEGLFFDDIFEREDAPSFFKLLSYTTTFDDYYFYITGQRITPVAKPRQPMPEIMREILVELEAHHFPRYLDAACTLLDMNSETRDVFAENVVKQRELTLKDQGFHDFSIVFGKPSIGITYMFALSERALDLQKRLAGYCILKKYQTKTNLWVGLGCIVDVPGWAQTVIVSKSPWEYDGELENLIAASLPPLDTT